MSKEIVPLEVKDIPELEKSSNPQLFSPVVPYATTSAVHQRLSGFDNKTLSTYLSSLAGLSVSPTLVGLGLESFLNLSGSFTTGMGASGIALFISICSLIVSFGLERIPGQKRRNRKYKAVYDAILEKNFQAFLDWAKLRYNIVIDINSLPQNNLANLKNVFSNVSSLRDDFAWVKNTMGKTYLIRKTTSGDYYLVEETNDEAPQTLVLTEATPNHADFKLEKVYELFTGETPSLWDALQSRLTTIENFGLSVENAHVVKRVRQDCEELLTNMHKLSQLNATVKQEEVRSILSGLNQEIQNIIDQEIKTVDANISNMSSWVTSRNLSVEGNSLLSLSSSKEHLEHKHIYQELEK